MVISTKTQIEDKAERMNFKSISISGDNFIKPLVFIVTAQCKIGQKWQNRKHDRFKKWLMKNKMVTVNIIYKRWRP